MRRKLLALAAGLIFLGMPVAAHAGQPGVECEDTRPGNSSSAPGSAFNEDGVAGTKYAGEQDQNNNNPKSVSQYDVACTKTQSQK